MEVTFDLVHNDDCIVVKTTNTLKEIVDYVRKNINDARKYGVDEMEDGELVETCSAFYLLETYKDLEKLPLSLHDC